MIVKMNVNVPFDFCVNCPHKDINTGSMNEYYCNRFDSCAFVVSKVLDLFKEAREREEDDGR